MSILSQVFLLALSQVVVTHTSEIRHEINHGGGGGVGDQCRFQNEYHGSGAAIYTAPARFVPSPAVDPVLQQEFLRLFQPQSSFFHNGSYQQETLPPGLTTQDLQYMATICPKDAFFYSLSPQHVIARNMLQAYLAAQPTPGELLRVARIILKNHEINPKIWYYALQGAALERPDMNGYIIAQPLDAMPDLFIPAGVLGEALKYSGGGGGIGSGFNYGVLTHTLQVRYLSAECCFSRKMMIVVETLPQQRALVKDTYPHHPKRAVRRTSRGGNRNRNVRKITPHSAGQDHHGSSDAIQAESSIAVATTITKENGNGSGGTRGSRSISKEHYGNQLNYGEGEIDAELAELMRIHESSNNSTRLIRQFYARMIPRSDKIKKQNLEKYEENIIMAIRIIQRRQRRKGKTKRVKRQLFGSPQAHIHHDGIGQCILVNGTVGADNGEENRLWYFREDIQLNSHHW
ncbi:Phenoloxidase 2 [Orchesella cincta]|uniref:Phenoloxidase 2 n=1 Tax=Orchesella cincta TaxID=48709 RepID=A0A1D2N852_ORCCI|nr:Phenoloxidase 2 [Orchesella cincta]